MRAFSAPDRPGLHSCDAPLRTRVEGILFSTIGVFGRDRAATHSSLFAPDLSNDSKILVHQHRTNFKFSGTFVKGLER